MKRLSALAVLLCCLLNQAASQSHTDGYLYAANFEQQIGILKLEYGRNKKIPSSLELACLAALSFYPELKETPIEFRFGRLHSTMASRPKMLSVFRQQDRREYVIIIQQEEFSGSSVSWRELTFNSLVGWIGHELGHVLHYAHKTGAGIMVIGMKYGFPSSRSRMERFADQLAIQHHLGFPLYEGVDYTMNCSHASHRYLHNQQKYYLAPGEIIGLINHESLLRPDFKRTRIVIGGN